MGKMNDVTDMPDPLDHDPVLDRYLARLGHYAPAPGFENRVLANVYVPAPRWLQALRERARSLVETKRVWWLAGGFAASSVISITIVTAVVLTNAASVQMLFGLFNSQVALPAWRAMLGIVSGIAYDLYSLFGAANVSTAAFVAVSLSVLAILVFNSWAVYRLMQPARGIRVQANALR